MTDLPQRLRHLAEQLVYGTVEPKAVSPGLLHSAADEIDRLRAHTQTSKERPALLEILHECDEAPTDNNAWVVAIQEIARSALAEGDNSPHRRHMKDGQ